LLTKYTLIYEMVFLLTMLWLHVFYPKDRVRLIWTNISIMTTKQTLELYYSQVPYWINGMPLKSDPPTQNQGRYTLRRSGYIQYPIQYTRVDNVIRWDERSRCIFLCVVIVIGGLQKNMIGKDNEKHRTKQRT